jgi:response regulator of citrate/malate metabolism
MERIIGTIPLDDLFAQVDKALTNERPPNSFTAQEYAAARNIPRSTAATRLNQLVASGTLSTSHHILNGTRRTLYTLCPTNTPST